MNLLGARVLASKGPLLPWNKPVTKQRGPWLAFDQAWFRRNQAWLLFGLNTPILGRAIRKLLYIDMAVDCWLPRATRVIEIGPSYYKVQCPDGQLRLIARTHPKYAKRVYYAWKPLWWLIHAWDSAFADRFAPGLSYGFLTLTAYPDPDPETATVDGQVARLGTNLSWADIRDGVGTNVADDSANNSTAELGSGTSAWSNLYRGIVLFNTSGLGAEAIISAAVLSVYGALRYNDFSFSFTLAVFTSTPASNVALVTGDYSSLGAIAQSNSIGSADYITTGFNDFTLNATGRGNVSLTGISKFATREATYDAPNTSPTFAASKAMFIRHKSADTAGTTSDPKLVVTYTAGATLGGPLVGGRLTNSSLLIGGRLVQQ